MAGEVWEGVTGDGWEGVACDGWEGVACDGWEGVTGDVISEFGLGRMVAVLWLTTEGTGE